MKTGDTISLKVCGMRDERNIWEVAALQPDYMGFIFYEKSPRFVGPDFVMPPMPGEIRKVGVFVNERTEIMIQIRERYELDYLQLHGTESPEQLAEVKKRGIGIIKVFSVDDEFDFDRTRAYEEYADFFLFDAKGKYYGGNASLFNWRILEQYNQRVPFFLSGGIKSESIPAMIALKGMNVHAVDINSGVESAPAMKDASMISALKNELKKIKLDK